mgnify:CR=1 FL=1
MQQIKQLIEKLDPAEYEKLLVQVDEYRCALEREKSQRSFMEYVKSVWPGFVHGRHHVLMAKKFEEIAAGKVKRLIINMAPRHTHQISLRRTCNCPCGLRNKIRPSCRICPIGNQ